MMQASPAFGVTRCRWAYASFILTSYALAQSGTVPDCLDRDRLPPQKERLRELDASGIVRRSGAVRWTSDE